MNYKLNVGYDGKLEHLKMIIEASDKVKTVYTGGVKNKVSGGRFQYSNTVESLKEHVD